MRQHDCGSTSCKFATNRSGQRNNGPCRCMREADARIEGLEEILRDLAYYLRVYVHAHQTDNRVPPGIEQNAIQAMKACDAAAGVEVDG